jgi:putative membrane protein
MKILLNWVISALLILVIAYVLPGVSVTGFFVALVVALVLGLINAFIKPVVLFFALPINMVTMGLFSFVIDAVMVMVAAWAVSGFDIDGFWWALVFALALAVVNMLIKDRGPASPMTR